MPSSVKEQPFEDDSTNEVSSPYATSTTAVEQKNFMGRFVDSFRQMEFDESLLKPGMTEAEKTEVRLANTPLQKSLKKRHLQMIAIGGSSGSALRTGGAASLPIAWVVVGTFLFAVIHALGELAVALSSPRCLLCLCYKIH
ncbi:unnamed protein product [Wickerhamomyces anomalus]